METAELKQELDAPIDSARGVILNVATQINTIKRRIGFSIVARDHAGQIKLVWAAVEERQADSAMEEANTVKLALFLAKQKGWQEVLVQGTNSKVMLKLMQKDSNDAVWHHPRQYPRF